MLYQDLCKEFPIKSIEDGFDEDDWEGWTAFTKDVGKDVQIVGDDLTVTNPIRIEKAAKMGACNALLLKVNQIGSVTESINAVKLAKQSGNDTCYMLYYAPANTIFLHLVT